METFPDIRPDRFTMDLVYTLEDRDIRSETDLHQLIQILYDHPEREVYLFHEVGVPGYPDLLDSLL